MAREVSKVLRMFDEYFSLWCVMFPGPVPVCFHILFFR